MLSARDFRILVGLSAAACAPAELSTSVEPRFDAAQAPPLMDARLVDGARTRPPAVEDVSLMPEGDVFMGADMQAASGLDAAPELSADAAPVPNADAATEPPALPECPCFVRAAWCGESAAAHGLTLDPPCRVPLVPEHADDVLGCDGDRWVVQAVCAAGCYSAPSGTPDSCNAAVWPPCPSAPLLHAGLHPEASDRLRCAGVQSDEITQTIGNAAASAGYHARDGSVDGRDYCAAVDLRSRGRSNAQIRALLARLGEHGFAAWYREPGADGWPADEAAHLHAVFAGVPMKAQLEGQVRDFLAGLNGLASHRPYGFWTPAPEVLDLIRALFERHAAP